jgi:hypothetical protein
MVRHDQATALQIVHAEHFHRILDDHPLYDGRSLSGHEEAHRRWLTRVRSPDCAFPLSRERFETVETRQRRSERRGADPLVEEPAARRAARGEKHDGDETN